MKRILLVLIVFAVIAVSGCNINTSGGFAMGDGLQIKEFAFKPARLSGGQSTLLTVELQNMGSKNIEDANMRIYGLSTGGDDDGSWSGEVIGSTYGGSVDEVINLGGFRAANPELKTEGQTRVVAFKLKSPIENLYGTEFNHNAYLRACYAYTTEAVAKIEVVGEDEWLLQEQTGSFNQHAIDVKQSSSPVSVTIESMQPVIAGDNVVINLMISNVGGGVAFSTDKDCDWVLGNGNEDEYDFDLNTIKIDGFGDCTIIGEGGGNQMVSLEKGSERSVSVKCEGGFSPDMPEQEFNINMRLEYNYYIESQANVVVVGIEGESEELPAESSGSTESEETLKVCKYSPTGNVGASDTTGSCVITGSGTYNIMDGELIVQCSVENNEKLVVTYPSGATKSTGLNGEIHVYDAKCINGEGGPEVIMGYYLKSVYDEAACTYELSYIMEVQ